MRKILILMLFAAMFVFSKSEEDNISNYLNNIKVGNPIEYRNLKIFPILSKKTLYFQDFIILDQAMDNGYLKIKEAGSGEVNFVEVKNGGKKPVFIMTGEMLRGAKQDRMLKEDVLIPSNSGWIRVPVYCVEHGRWTQVTPEFKSEGLMAPNAVRERAKMTENQADVWDEIAMSQDKLGVACRTGTVRANYEDESVKKEVNEYTNKFEKIPKLSKSTIGVVVVTGNRIICFDMFANNGLLSKLWDKLIKSYAMDALTGEKCTVYRDDVEEFIAELKNVKSISVGTPGLGNLVTLESNFGKGSALVYKSAVVHMDFFPQDDFVDMDSGLRLDLRRNERLND